MNVRIAIHIGTSLLWLSNAHSKVAGRHGRGLSNPVDLHFLAWGRLDNRTNPSPTERRRDWAILSRGCPTRQGFRQATLIPRRTLHAAWSLSSRKIPELVSSVILLHTTARHRGIIRPYERFYPIQTCGNPVNPMLHLHHIIVIHNTMPKSTPPSVRLNTVPASHSPPGSLLLLSLLLRNLLLVVPIPLLGIPLPSLQHQDTHQHERQDRVARRQHLEAVLPAEDNLAVEAAL